VQLRSEDGRSALPRPRGSLPAAPRRSQSGFSLVEILISLLLVGIVVLGLAAGLYTLIRTTNDTMNRQKVQLGLSNFGESLKAAPYRDCAEPDGNATVAAHQSAYSAWSAAWTPPSGMTAGITKVEYWDPQTRSFVGACADTDHGAQRLTMTVTWRGRDGTAQIVKRA
jgi:prepilin-type N-terminal cleavage/methylation domain-containing protein